eukprot:COSAG06_NODE_17018_length_966_cov_1.838524_1_plen_321_part_11
MMAIPFDEDYDGVCTYDREACDMSWYECACEDNQWWWDLFSHPEGCGGAGMWPSDYYEQPICHVEYVENSYMEGAEELFYEVAECHGPHTREDLSCQMQCEYENYCTWDYLDEDGNPATGGNGYDAMACMACIEECPPAEGDCNGHHDLEGSVGEPIVQISEANGYNNNQNCEFHITCEPDSVPLVTFHYLDLESNFDYVHVMDGDCAGSCEVYQFWAQEGECDESLCRPANFADGTPTAWLDGWDTPPPIMGVSGEMTVLLTTDGSVTYGGFDATFECISTVQEEGDCPEGMTLVEEQTGDFCITDADGNGIDDHIDAEI